MDNFKMRQNYAILGSRLGQVEKALDEVNLGLNNFVGLVEANSDDFELIVSMLDEVKSMTRKISAMHALSRVQKNSYEQWYKLEKILSGEEDEDDTGFAW